MDKPDIADTTPRAVETVAGETYYWCACGKSQNQPFCDGSHRGSSLTPVHIKAVETETVYLCMCKQTGNPPFCDGSHSRL